jgi:hypothetical protein
MVTKNSNQPNGSTCSPECKQAYSRQKWVKTRYDGFEKFLRLLQNQVRSRANRKGLEFDLPEEYVYDLYRRQGGKCARTGVKFVLEGATGRARGHPYVPSVDRVDPLRGYTMDNVELVTYVCNTSRNAFPHDVFKKFCVEYLEHQGIKCIPKEVECQ